MSTPKVPIRLMDQISKRVQQLRMDWTGVQIGFEGHHRARALALEIAMLHQRALDTLNPEPPDPEPQGPCL